MGTQGTEDTEKIWNTSLNRTLCDHCALSLLNSVLELLPLI